ncbi:hypothetical protein GCM10009555_061680 [Acrocarpospora macrocephala]|uniref:DNA-binding protein n=1 Tax=Acrocarpospora macrocephala TaxID=150177 RepID=A0A5M3WQP7_9ACTN|nr:OB-fold domain-containing protein [Acrocarpospora macrocephala]GES09611.1 hypothetical protein Amac_032070 [Acrocarpospora macrocephala]
MSLFPVPAPDQIGEPFWAAVAERRLTVQRCPACREWTWQPKPVCPACGSPDLTWEAVSGRATVCSWTTPRPPVLPAFESLVPFVVLLVELDEGVRMVGQLVGDAGDLLRTDGTDVTFSIGTRVTLRWRDQDGQWLPSWAVDR